jgi:hypothetical protein
VCGDVDADFGHRFDAERMHVASRLRTSAGDFEDVTGHMAQQAFGEVRAAGIAGAEDEDEGLGGGHGKKEILELSK